MSQAHASAHESADESADEGEAAPAYEIDKKRTASIYYSGRVASTHTEMVVKARVAGKKIYEVESQTEKEIDGVLAVALHAGIHGLDEPYERNADAVRDFWDVEMTRDEFDAALPRRVLSKYLRARQALVDTFAAWLEGERGAPTRRALAKAEKGRDEQRKRARR